MLERRNPNTSKPSPLPQVFLKMVTDVFTTNFSDGLRAFEGTTRIKPVFTATGEIFNNEIVLAVTLSARDKITATTVYGSCDFDPKASSPTTEELLNACVDAIGSMYSFLLAPDTRDRLEQLADESLSALEGIPYSWTKVEIEKRTVFLKLDKANPALDKMTDDWLAKNDPNYEANLKREQEETEKLFVTGAAKSTPKPSGTKH